MQKQWWNASGTQPALRVRMDRHFLCTSTAPEK